MSAITFGVLLALFGIFVMFLGGYMLALARIRRLRRQRDVRALDEARDAYHDHWYIPAIRELAGTERFRADPSWIAQVLRPRITPNRAEEALATLEKLALLARDPRGIPRPVSVQVTTELEPRSAHIAAFHRTMIGRALEAIDTIGRTERDISSITLGVDESGLTGLKRRIQQIREELLDEFDAGRDGVQVVQVNFQLFPLSEQIEKGKR